MNLRELSKQVGFKNYQGKPCLHGHDGVRYVSNDACVTCDKVKSAKYYAANVEKVKDKATKYYDSNPDKLKAKIAKQNDIHAAKRQASIVEKANMVKQYASDVEKAKASVYVNYLAHISEKNKNV